MSVTISGGGLPANVVEIGNEVTQGIVDALNGASPSPTSSNVFATASNIPAFATATEAFQLSSTTKVVSPSVARYTEISTNSWISGVQNLTANASGAGASSTSGATALSGTLQAPNTLTAGYASRGFTLAFPSNSVGDGYNYGTISGHAVRVKALWETTITGVKIRAVFGRMSATLPVPATLASRGYGWEWDWGTKTISIIAHNGTSLTSTAQTWTPSSSRTYTIMCTTDVAGNVSLYIDNVFIGTITGNATSTVGASTQIWWQIEMEQSVTTTANQTQIIFSNPKVITTNG
jgi:hypothetical protein